MISDALRDTPEDALEKKILIDFLHAALGELSDVQRTVISLRYLSDTPMTRKAIGEVVGLSAGGVDFHERNGLDKLQRAFHRKIHAPPAGIRYRVRLEQSLKSFYPEIRRKAPARYEAWNDEVAASVPIKNRSPFRP